MVKTPIAEPSPTETDPDWHRPGPGTWTIDRDHTGPTPSRPARDLLSEAAEAGMAEAFSLLGAPLETMRIRFVNGRFYRRMVPAVGADGDRPAPPAPVLWLAARLHPRLRARERAARRALQDRLWLAELARWEDEWRPYILERNRVFATIDPATLGDDGLAAHLLDLWEHLRWTSALHFRLHGSDIGPIGLLVVETDDLGIDRAAVFAALAGASPATTGPAEAIAEVRSTVLAALEDRGLATPPTTLEELRDLGPGVAAEVDALVERYGWRLTTGYDLVDRTLVELPGVLAGALTARDGSVPSSDALGGAGARGDRAGSSMLERVPEARRDEIATMLDDARRCYGLRDENGPITYEWPAGLLRRALLEAAERLVRRGALHARDHVFDATISETAGLLDGADAPGGDDLGRRHDVRMSWGGLDAPPELGPPEAVPALWTLPPAMRTLTRAVITVMDLVDGERAPDLHGLGVGTERYVGTARIVADAADAFDTVRPGDVLVTTATVPTFNAVLAIAGAVVVEEGGLLSHAAVIAREFGLPAVIGATGATTTIPDGATVEVDPVAGTVRVVGADDYATPMS